MPKDYIERGALIKKIFPYEGIDKMKYTINAKAVHEGIRKAPAADVVSRELFEQVKWERDIATAQLEEHGIAFGEKKTEVRRGEWIRATPYSQDYCNQCGLTPKTLFGRLPPFCPNCGAKMGDEWKDGERKKK